jgi:hypothetical protein
MVTSSATRQLVAATTRRQAVRVPRPRLPVDIDAAYGDREPITRARKLCDAIEPLLPYSRAALCAIDRRTREPDPAAEERYPPKGRAAAADRAVGGRGVRAFSPKVRQCFAVFCRIRNGAAVHPDRVMTGQVPGGTILAAAV